MARGQKDYAGSSQKTVGATLSDMGELAARLGSIVTFDRRGDIILLDDFEDPLMKWNLSGEALGFAGRLDQTGAKTGSQCLKITSPADTDKNVAANRRIDYVGAPRLGQEVSFSRLSSVGYIENRMDVFTGSRKVEFRLKYDQDAGTLSYYDVDGAWQVLASGLTLAVASFYYWTWKLVGDATEEKYARALLGSREHDLSSIAAKASDDTTEASVLVFITSASVNAEARSVLYDHYILTMNEP